MLNANHAALFFTVAMLAVTTYFLFGSIPLLVLKHDDTMDAKFIQSFYITYFKIAIVVAIAATVSYALAARPLLSLEAAAIAGLTWLLRFKFVPKMAQYESEIHENSQLMAIPEFRKIHKTAILLNATQLLTVLASLSFI
jgi:hypothetical protein